MADRQSAYTPMCTLTVYPLTVLHAITALMMHLPFHLSTATQEIFLQLQGDMTIETYEKGKPRTISVKEGHIYLLPGDTPHSPQRLAGTVGLVLERERLPHEVDALRWYTKGGDRILYEETFHCTDLGQQLKPAIERFFASDSFKTDVPNKQYGDDGCSSPVHVDVTKSLGDAINLREWAAHHANGKNVVLYGAGAAGGAGFIDCEYRVEVKSVPDAEWEGSAGASAASSSTSTSTASQCATADGWICPPAGELFLYQFDGHCDLQVRDNEASSAGGEGGSSVTTHSMGPQSVFLLPAGRRFSVRAHWHPGSLCLVVTNAKALK